MSATTNHAGRLETSYEEFLQAWPVLAPDLHADPNLRAQTWKAIAEGDVELFASSDAAVLVSIREKSDLRLRHALAALCGGPATSVELLMDQVAVWAKANACTHIAVNVSPDEAPAYSSFQPLSVVLHRNLA